MAPTIDMLMQFQEFTWNAASNAMLISMQMSRRPAHALQLITYTPYTPYTRGERHTYVGKKNNPPEGVNSLLICPILDFSAGRGRN